MGVEQTLAGLRGARQIATLGSESIGKIVFVEGQPYYVDIARNPFVRNRPVFLFVDANGEIDVVMEGSPWKGKYIVKYEAEGMPPSQNLYEFSVFTDAELVGLEEAFDMAVEVLKQTVVFRDPRLYELVAAWCAYTWLRGLFPKNVNLYFIGFPATGKSQALRFCKLFARYPVDYDPSAEKSYKWNISYTLGTLLIDEAEYISRVQAAKLRKYHEAGVVETRLIGLPLVGLTPINLRVDAPLVLAATHPPPDTAFLQRGYIIRMQKGSPEIKDFTLIPDLEQRRYTFAKSALCHWKKVFDSLNRVYFQLSFSNIDERIKDLVVPVAAVLEALGRDWDWVVEYAKYSFTQANFVTPETTAFIQTLALIRDEAERVGDKYVLPMRKVSEIMRLVGEVLCANPSKLNYLRQYLFAGCEIGLKEGELVYVADKATVDALIENLSLIRLGELEEKALGLREFLRNATKLVRVTVTALKRYVVENDLAYKSGVVKVPVEELRRYIDDRGYRKLGARALTERLAKAFGGGVPRPLAEAGVGFTLEGDTAYMVVELDKFRPVLDEIE